MNRDVLTTPALEALLKAPSLAIVAVDRQGRVILWGSSASRMFGWKESEVLGRPIPIVPKPQRHELHDRIQRGLKGETVAALEVRRQRRDGSLVDVSLWTAPLRDGKGKIIGVLGVLAEITARKRAEEALQRARDELERRVAERTKELIQANVALLSEVAKHKETEAALRESEQRFRQVTRSIREVFWMTNPDKTEMVYISPAYEEVWGRTCASLIEAPMTWLDAIHPEDRERVRQAALTKQTNGEYDQQYRIVRPDGSIRWIRDRAFSVQNEKGKLIRVAGIAEDITEWKELEQSIVEITNREQVRIGLDLHDGLCQQLTGIAFLWKNVANNVVAGVLPKVPEIAQIGQLIATVIDEARGLARGLCPVELERNDLSSALKELGSSVERLLGVSCTVRCQRGIQPMQETTAVHLYRIAQEAINNAIRHGKPTHVWIDFALKKSKPTLRIRDNGVGIRGRQPGRRGLGIRSMRYRAQMIGATLAIESNHGAGTTVTCVCSRPSSLAGGDARCHPSK